MPAIEYCKPYGRRIYLKTRIFHTKFWTDPYIIKLDTKARCLYAYYLTNDRIGLTGIYEVPLMLTQMSTGLSIEEIETYNKKFMEDEKIIFYKEWVCIKNASKYQAYTGEKNEKARLLEENIVPLEVRGFFSKYTMHTLSETENSLINRNHKSEIEIVHVGDEEFIADGNTMRKVN